MNTQQQAVYMLVPAQTGVAVVISLPGYISTIHQLLLLDLSLTFLPFFPGG